MAFQGNKIGAIMCGATITIDAKDLTIARPYENEERMATLPTQQAHDKLTGKTQAQVHSHGGWIQFGRSNWAAECLLKIGRPDEALAHAEYYDKEDWHLVKRAWAPWLRGRCQAAIAKAQGAGESAEAVELFEKACSEAEGLSAPCWWRWCCRTCWRCAR